MKRTILLAAVVVLVASAVGVGSSYYEYQRGPTYGFSKPLRSGDIRDPAVAGKAKIEVIGPREHDFGTMSKQESRDHTFTVKNVGDGQLTLKFIEKSCQCTSVAMTRHIVEPGETTDITLTWEPNKYGVLYQVARFETNDYSLQELDLTITGDVKQIVSAVPPSLEFRNSRSGKPTTRTVMIYGYRDDDLVVESVEFLKASTSDHFEAKVEPLSKAQLEAEPGAKSGASIVFTLNEGVPIGAFTQRIRIHTNQTDLEPIEIPVDGSVVGRLSVFGPGVDRDTGIIELGVLRGNKELKRLFFVRVLGVDAETDVNIVEVDPAEVLDASLGAPTVDPANGNLKTYPLTIRITPNGQLVDRSGTKVGPLGKIVIGSSQEGDPQMNQYVSFRLEGNK